MTKSQTKARLTESTDIHKVQKPERGAQVTKAINEKEESQDEMNKLYNIYKVCKCVQVKLSIRSAGIRSDSFLGEFRISIPVTAILLGVVFSILAT